MNPIERIELLIDYIQRDLGKATVDRELQRQIQTSIDRRERENYLREQLRVIQDELGDTNGAEREADTYRDRVEALPLAEEHKLQLRREVNRLAQLSPSSSDYAVIKGHLDTVFQVPWTEKTEDRLDLAKAEEILDERHYGLEKVKERVLEFLAVLKLKGDLKGPILCFVGTSGRRQDVARRRDRRRARTEVRPDGGRRRDRRVGDPRPSQDLHRRDAGEADPELHPGRREQPADHDRRDRQDRERLPRRSVDRRCSKCSIRSRTTPSSIATSRFRTTSRTRSSSARRTSST